MDCHPNICHHILQTVFLLAVKIARNRGRRSVKEKQNPRIPEAGAFSRGKKKKKLYGLILLWIFLKSSYPEAGRCQGIGSPLAVICGAVAGNRLAYLQPQLKVAF